MAGALWSCEHCFNAVVEIGRVVLLLGKDLESLLYSDQNVSIETFDCFPFNKTLVLSLKSSLTMTMAFQFSTLIMGFKF